jgi:hypothetical protein
MTTASKIVRAHSLLLALKNYRSDASVQVIDNLYNALSDLEVFAGLRNAILIRFTEMVDFSDESITREAVKAVLDTEL